MVEAAEQQEAAVEAEPAGEVEPPELGSVERRLQRRAETLEILADPAWPGDGALGAPAARSAMWWCIGAAILLAFPRQYIAAIGAVALSLVFLWLDRRNKPAEAEDRSDASPSSADIEPVEASGASEPEPVEASGASEPEPVEASGASEANVEPSEG